MNPVQRPAQWISFEEDDLVNLSHRENLVTGPEYVIAPDLFSFSQNYFSSAPKHPEERVEISLHGRKIQVFGLSEIDSKNEFNRAFGEIIHPIVDVKALANVVDRCISSELMKIFEQLTPVLPERDFGGNSSFFSLTREESIQIASEDNLFDSDFPTQGELRTAVERIPSAKAKRYLLNRSGPIITPQEIEVAKTIMKINKIKKNFLSLLSPEFQPYQIKNALDTVPLEYKHHFAPLSTLIDKRIQVFETLSENYSPVYTIEFLLGEELYKRILKNLPICWRLPKENVTQLHRLIEYQQKKPSVENGQDAPLEFFCNIDPLVVKKVSDLFSSVKDYIIDQEFLPTLLPFIHMPLNPWPRIERVKQAFQIYARVEKLLFCVTDEMFRILETIKADGQREHIGKILEESKTKQDKLKVLKPYILKSQFSGEEEDVLIEFVSVFVPLVNDFLFDPILVPSGAKPEIMQLAKQIQNDFSIEQISHLILEFSKLNETSEKQKILQFYGIKTNLSSCDMDELLDFLVTGDPLEYERSAKEDLIELEKGARQTLDNECRSAGVRIVFRQRGCEVTLGAVDLHPDPENNQVSSQHPVIEEENDAFENENDLEEFEIIDDY